MPDFKSFGFVAAVLWSLTGIALGGRPTHDDESVLTGILRRTATYVHQFDDEFAVVISNEHYEQQRTLFEGRSPRQEYRRIESEMLFMWLADQQRWLSVRNVLSVDGQAITDSASRLDRALADPAPDRLPRLLRLRDEGARFNVGVYRNFNDPALVLQFFDQAFQTRFRFDLEGKNRVNKTEAWKINFVERRRPTVIRDGEFDVPSQGSIWASVADGAVVRTTLALSTPASLTTTVAHITVDYGRDPKLTVAAPTRMEERYVTIRAGGVEVERIGCVATYSNYRRFETSGRIIPPKQ
ncbi:MAG TPA: hypothetical protein VNZ26_10245 [Vicinamibacterales bacterium]|nr:hypothetical protein [Vicinamibacterales bacterium]